MRVSEVSGKVSNWEVLRSGVKKSCHLYSYIFRPIDLVLIRLECQYEEILHKIRTMIVPKWNCDRILLFHFCLLIPLYPVLNKLMNIFSLSFLNASSGERIFSRMITCMSLTQCPLRLKWAPVAWSSILFRTYPLCCPKRVARDFPVSPIYCMPQCRQVMQYITLHDWQVTAVSMSWV